jgi:hypothetical protein
MSDHGSSAKAILYAFIANLGIALAKLAASIYTNSGSMMAEAIHSFADCGNQVLLYLGLRQAQKPPDAKHPLGYGKVTYFWSFIVALLLFSMGGLFSMYEGWHKLHAPEQLNQAWIALAVLGASILLEFGSLVGCLREIKKLRKGQTTLALGEDHAQRGAGGGARRGPGRVVRAGARVRIRLAGGAHGQSAVRRRRLDRHRRGPGVRVDLHRQPHQGPAGRKVGRR